MKLKDIIYEAAIPSVSVDDQSNLTLTNAGLLDQLAQKHFSTDFIGSAETNHNIEIYFHQNVEILSSDLFRFIEEVNKTARLLPGYKVFGSILLKQGNIMLKLYGTLKG